MSNREIFVYVYDPEGTEGRVNIGLSKRHFLALAKLLYDYDEEFPTNDDLEKIWSDFHDVAEDIDPEYLD